MNQYIIALVIANVAWFGFVVMILNAFHRLRLKYENEIDVLNHKRNQESEAAERVAGLRRELQKIADERALKIDKLQKDIVALEGARDRYVNNVIDNQNTIADLKSQLETANKLNDASSESLLEYEQRFNELDAMVRTRDANIANLDQNVERLKEEAIRFSQLAHTRGTELDEMQRRIGERDASIHELEQRAERLTLECSRRANEVVKLQRSCDQHRAEEVRLSKLLNEANARTRDSDIAHDAIAAKFARLRKLVSESISELRSQMEENSK